MLPAVAHEINGLREQIRKLEDALARQKEATGDALDREAAMKARLIAAANERADESMRLAKIHAAAFDEGLGRRP